MQSKEKGYEMKEVGHQDVKRDQLYKGHVKSHKVLHVEKKEKTFQRLKSPGIPVLVVSLLLLFALFAFFCVCSAAVDVKFDPQQS